MSAAREAFVAWCRAQLGKPVLWGQLDCSELVARGILAVGGPDMRATHTAQRMHDETPDLVTSQSPAPLDGDLMFYGLDAAHVVHVAIWFDGGRVLSADGATRRIKTLAEAEKAGARVRIHDAPWRSDFRSVHRNVYVDRLDGVKRE